MRIAAGVLLILVAILNLIAAMAFTAGGAAGAATIEAATELQQSNIDTLKKAGAKPEEIEKAQKALDEIKGQGDKSMGGFMGWGIFLFVLCGLQIAGAVVLFRSKAAKFALVVGALTIVGELGGTLGMGVPFGAMNIFGIVTGVLALLSAKGYMDGGGAAEA